jgi:uncharacterized protein (TIGR03118 family)
MNSCFRVAFTVTVMSLLVGTAPAQFLQTNLVSDGSVPANRTDSDFINAWGLARSATGPWWVNAADADTSYVWDGAGDPFPAANPLEVSVPGGPTGIVFHDGSGFVVHEGELSGPSRFMFATESGTIQGWNPSVNLTQAVVAVDNSGSGASYKGLAIFGNGPQERIYAANFAGGVVEAYDTDFHLVGVFTDGTLPENYAPFGIRSFGGKIVVTFALRDEEGEDVSCPGCGFVDVFNRNGVFERRLVSEGVLNAPWGLVQAPDHFGGLAGKLLIGNFGDGRINAFDFEGISSGPLLDLNGDPIEIDGLWGLDFGNGAVAGSRHTLYFTAGPNDETGGLFGKIEAQDMGGPAAVPEPVATGSR